MTSAYDRLLERLRRIGALREAAEVLGWDQQTMMPPGGTEARAHQSSALAAVVHETLTAPETLRLLAEAEKAEKDPVRVAMLRETRFVVDRATRVPPELVEAMAQAQARGFEKWVEAKKKSDFSLFRDDLANLLDLRRRYAQAIDPGRDVYEVLFQDYEPWVDLEDARRTLLTLRDGLRPLVQKARERDATRPTTFDGAWPADAQEALARKVVAMIGYDFQRGRMDTAPHPFMAGNVYDVRITTRYYPDNPLPSLLGAMHEAGHALYQQGLPTEHFGTPLGEPRDLIVHESQSRLWENHVGRSRAFWERALPMMREAYPGKLDKVTVDEAWRAANHAAPSLIRVDADELTYHMHIALRFELEERLMSGKLDVDGVPQAWNAIMERDLGLTPPNDAKGCLQDMHWATGSFGYFPTYSLGSILSAQLVAAYERSGGSMEDWGRLLAWLRENVHRHGKRYETMDLVERATGKTLSADDFLRYANDKYAKLWA